MQHPVFEDVDPGIVERKGNRYNILSEGNEFFSEAPSKDIRRFHDQVLRKAQQALVEQSVDERNFNTTIIGVDSGDVVRFDRGVTLYIEADKGGALQ